jgi:peptidoglycan/LPS O-acetylase OafA/YrhL
MTQTQEKTGAYAQPKRIESLDTIRGLAALAVLLGHSIGIFAWPGNMVSWAKLPLINILFDGRSAVTMFFVLSGFVLSKPYVTKISEDNRFRPLNVSTFYMRRFTRIWIPWFCVFCISIVMRELCFRHIETVPPISQQGREFWQADITVLTFLKQCIFGFHNASQQLLPQDWSLGVELRGSLLVPVLIFLARRHVFLLLSFGLGLLVVLPNGFYYFSFVLGVFAAMNIAPLQSGMRRLGFYAKCAILALGLLLYQTRLLTHYLCTDTHFVDCVTWCICSIGCVIIITVSLSSRRIQTTLSHGVLVFLGKVSYSVFLLQMIILLCALPPITLTLNNMGVHNLIVLMPITIAMAVMMTVALAAVGYRFIEVPSISLGHWISLRISPQSQSRNPPLEGQKTKGS